MDKMTLEEQLAMARLDEFVCNNVKVNSFRTIRPKPDQLPLVKSVRVKGYLYRCRRVIKRLDRALAAQQGSNS